jgi:multicomponent Na+:H+ antiporter subunit E
MRRILILLLVSVAIFEARIDALPILLLAAVAALAAGRLLPAHGDVTLRPLRLLRFTPFFAVQSVRGGIDVALRAFRPGPPLEPAFVEYEMRVSSVVVQVFFANTVSLMPGTLSARLEDGVLTIHTLSDADSVAQRLERLELRIAHVFGEARVGAEAA